MNSKSSMQWRVKAYLEERRRLGFAMGISGSQLMRFARFADESGHKGTITAKLILNWVTSGATRPRPMTSSRRVEVVRPFAKYCAQFEQNTEIPPRDLFGPAHRRITPHIYSDDEVSDLLAAAGKLPPKGKLRPRTYQTLFGLIAATGLRISEALNLEYKDVDLAGGRLTIRNTKFRKARYIPLHPTVTKALSRYVAFCRLHTAASDRNWFFVSDKGNRLANRTVHNVFEDIRNKLGWKPRGGHSAPRIHDLRHTFVCKRVRLWHEQGIDVDTRMLALSTYLGHAKVSDTYWYLTGIPGLMAVAAARFENAQRAAERNHE